MSRRCESWPADSSVANDADATAGASQATKVLETLECEYNSGLTDIETGVNHGHWGASKAGAI